MCACCLINISPWYDHASKKKIFFYCDNFSVDMHTTTDYTYVWLIHVSIPICVGIPFLSTSCWLTPVSSLSRPMLFGNTTLEENEMQRRLSSLQRLLGLTPNTVADSAQTLFSICCPHQSCCQFFIQKENLQTLSELATGSACRHKLNHNGILPFLHHNGIHYLIKVRNFKGQPDFVCSHVSSTAQGMEMLISLPFHYVCTKLLWLIELAFTGIWGPRGPNPNNTGDWLTVCLFFTNNRSKI